MCCEIVVGTSFFFFLRPERLRSQEPETKEVNTVKARRYRRHEHDAHSFRQFADRQYQLEWWLCHQRDDARKHPRVSAAQVALTIIVQVFLALRSLLRADQWLRTPMACVWLGLRVTAPRGSDMTLLRVLTAWQRWRRRQATYALHRALHQQRQDRTVLSTGKQVQLAIVDVTVMGGQRFSVLSFVGAVFPPVDVEPSRGRGHELTDSRRWLHRAVKALEVGFATRVLYDRLMAVKRDFVRVRNIWGMQLVVKTKEQTLEVVQSCWGAWARRKDEPLRRAGVQAARGVDAARGLSYRVCAQSGIPWHGLDEPWNVAWVQETP